MKIAEVKELSDKELLERLSSEEIALTQMVLDHKFSHLENPMDIRKKRRTIARIRTVMTQRGLNK